MQTRYGTGSPGRAIADALARAHTCE